VRDDHHPGRLGTTSGGAVHGWIYGLRDGRLRDLGVDVSQPEQLPRAYDTAIQGLLAAGS